jgi:hypothetical protein
MTVLASRSPQAQRFRTAVVVLAVVEQENLHAPGRRRALTASHCLASPERVLDVFGRVHGSCPFVGGGLLMNAHGCRGSVVASM